MILLQQISPGKVKGFVKLKKSKNSEESRKWVGWSSPKSDFCLFFKLCLFVFFCIVFMFLNSSKKKLVIGLGG